jgi:hypothetical protein
VVALKWSSFTHEQCVSANMEFADTSCFCAIQELALMLQSRVSEVLHVDIHPAAEVGRGILMVRPLGPFWHASASHLSALVSLSDTEMSTSPAPSCRTMRLAL